MRWLWYPINSHKIPSNLHCSSIWFFLYLIFIRYSLCTLPLPPLPPNRCILNYFHCCFPVHISTSLQEGKIKLWFYIRVTQCLSASESFSSKNARLVSPHSPGPCEWLENWIFFAPLKKSLSRLTSTFCGHLFLLFARGPTYPPLCREPTGMAEEDSTPKYSEMVYSRKELKRPVWIWKQQVFFPREPSLVGIADGWTQWTWKSFPT